MVWQPNELEKIERDEQEARLRLEEARGQNETDETGEAQHEGLISKLEEEWKHALERLEHARKGSSDQG